uniref:Uncharacterized protein n=1 Tax=Panagrolaimus sp. ES5 TaxID=591445 RepID=A0AC34FVG5_9BILA
MSTDDNNTSSVALHQEEAAAIEADVTAPLPPHTAVEENIVNSDEVNVAVQEEEGEEVDEIPVAIEPVSDEDEIVIDVDGVQYPKEEEISHDPIIFEENVTITLGQPHTLVADGLVNFCMDNIHSGNDTFLQTHRLGGDELKNACHKFRGVQPGYARITESFGLKNNFKHIIHGIIPMIENITIVCELESDFVAFHHQIPAIDTIVDFSAEGLDDFFPSLQYTTQDYPAAAHQGYVEAEYTYAGNYYPTDEAYEYSENEATRKVDMSMNVERSENMLEQRSLI